MWKTMLHKSCQTEETLTSHRHSTSVPLTVCDENIHEIINFFCGRKIFFVVAVEIFSS